MTTVISKNKFCIFVLVYTVGMALLYNRYDATRREELIRDVVKVCVENPAFCRRVLKRDWI
jgi:hypothetical protein